VSRIACSSLIGLFMLAAACGGTSGPPVDLPAEQDSDVSVQVISHSFTDANVYMFVGPSRHRLGTAVGKRTTVFTVPWRAVSTASQIRLWAEPIGEHVAVTSDPLQVRPGNMVVWTLEVQLGASNANVFY